MRVLWVSHFLPYPPTGGVLQRGYGLLSRMAPKCELHLLAMHQPRLLRQTAGTGPTAKDDSIGALRKLCASVEVVDIPAEIRPFGRPRAALAAMLNGRSYTEQWLAGGAITSAVRRAVQRLRPDIVHLDTISLAPCAQECGGAVVSMGHHNVESHMMWRRSRNASSPLARFLLGVEAKRILDLERKTVNAVQINVVCSDLDAKRLRRLCGARVIHVAENGVLDAEADLGSIQSLQSHLSRRLLFVGRMSAYTNRDAATFLARDIWPLVGSRFADAELDIVGSGAPEAALVAARADARVRVHGFVRDLAPLLAGGAVFVCPVRDGGGTKLKVLDAMNRGLPIVAHPHALEGIDVDVGEHVLVATTAEEFANAIGELITSPQRRAAMAARAFRRVRERYAFDAIAPALLERFAQLVSTRVREARVA